MTDSRNMADQNRFFLTGSDFSELAILENSQTLNSNSVAEEKPETALKLAKFQKLDFNAIEKNLTKQRMTPKRLRRKISP